MSPRKSSTSSGSRSYRPRYLGVEVAGVTSIAPRWLERALIARLGEELTGGAVQPRVVRHEGSRALVEVGHRLATLARRRWPGEMPGPLGGSVSVTTVRTWGTLLKGKLWIRSSTPRRRPEGPRAR